MRPHISVWIAIVAAAFLLAALITITIKQPNLTSSAVIVPEKDDVKLCYELTEEGLTANANIADCCISLSNSAACQRYESKEIVDELYKCKSDRIIVANKALINFCLTK